MKTKYVTGSTRKEIRDILTPGMDKRKIARLYKHNLPIVHQILGNKSTTSGEELDGFARRYLPEQYKGIFSEGDRLPMLTNNSFVIINRPRNVHWIGAFNFNNTLYEYDSYARKNFIGGQHADKYIDFNTRNDPLPDQSKSSDCGQRVITTMLAVFGIKL